MRTLGDDSSVELDDLLVVRLVIDSCDIHKVQRWHPNCARTMKNVCVCEREREREREASPWGDDDDRNIGLLGIPG